MSLESLPTEILCSVCQDVADFGSNRLVGLTRASRRLHAVSNPILYSTDIRESGGLISMCYGLATRRNEVVRSCLTAGADPDLLFESRHDLERCFPSIVLWDDAVNFFRWFSSHLGEVKYAQGRYYFEYVHPAAFHNHPLRNANEAFRSCKAFYWTPLHVAAFRNDVQLLDLLLHHGANPSSAGRGVCPCYYQHVRRTFNRSFLDIRDPTEMLERRLVTRWSPLHVAVCKENFDCAQYLLSRFGLGRAKEPDDAVMAEAQRFFREEPRLASAAGVLFDPDSINRLTPRFDPLSPLHVAAEKYANVEDLERVYVMLKQAGCLEGAPSNVDIPDAFGDTPFAVAAFSGRTETFGTWLRDRGADVNFALQDSNGVRCSVLNALCKSGQHRDAILLVELGVDVNRDAELHSGEEYESVLHSCCGWCRYESEWTLAGKLQRQRDAIALLKRLLHAGADLDARAEHGITPLMSAAALNFPDAVREILESQPDVRAEDNNGLSALHHATARGLGRHVWTRRSATLVTMQLLLDNGADPNQRCAGKSAPPLFTGRYAIGAQPHAGAERFSLYPIDRHPDDSQSPMASIAPLLIDRGADPNIYLDHPRDHGDSLSQQIFNLQGHSLPVTAFYEGEFDSLDSLVACGAIVTYRDYLLMMRSLIDSNFGSKGAKRGAVQSLFRILNSSSLRLERPEDREDIMNAWTELLYLAVGKRPELVHVLAPHLSVTRRRGPGGKTVLHLLAQWHRKKGESTADFNRRVDETMADLMRCGVSRQIDQTDNSGRSPLHIAVDLGNVPVAKALVHYGASIHVEQRKHDGSNAASPLRSAIKSYSQESRFAVVDGILDAYPKWVGWSDCYWGLGNAGLLKDLILHFRDSNFDEPFRMAARTNKLIVKLIDLGVDVNEPDEDGNTPLHLLIQLLYPSNQSFNPSASLQGVNPSQKLRCAGDRSANTNPPEEIDPERAFWVFQDKDMNMYGKNITYESDSDFVDESSDDGESEDDSDECSVKHDHTIYYDPDPDLDEDFFFEDLRVMAANGDKDDCPKCIPREWDKHGRGRQLDRCDAWILSFYILLTEGGSLTIKNKAGMTALDYIEGLGVWPSEAFTNTYGRIITALQNFSTLNPLGSELSTELNGSSVLPDKGERFFLAYNRENCFLVVPRQEGTRHIKRSKGKSEESMRWRESSQWSWVGFW